MIAEREGPVLCEACRKNPAGIHIDKLEKGKGRRTFHFCENCAAKRGIVIPDHFLSKEEKGASDDLTMKMGSVEEDEILEVLSRQLEMPLVDLAELEVDRNVVLLLPRDLSERYRCLGVRIEGRDVVVVFGDPFDVRARDEVTDHLRLKGYEVRPAIAREKDIDAAIEKYYGVQ
jgi:hypothetical protein